MNPNAARNARKLKTIEKASRIDYKILSTPNVFKKKLLGMRRQFLSYYFIPPPMWRVLLRAASPARRSKPDFACIGPVRSGTTLLTDYIMQHPAVALPLAKELNIKDAPLMRMVLAQFPTEKQKARVEKENGMAITGYCSPVVPGMLFPYFAHNVSSSAKIVIILRNPVERIFSHWRWDQMAISMVKNDPIWKNTPGFDEIIRMEMELAGQGAGAGTSISGTPVGGYLQGSMYLPFIKHLHKFYPADQVKIVNANAFFKDPAATAKEVYRFLGLPEYEPVPTPVKNAGPKMKLNDDTRELMEAFFAPINERLYDYLGVDFGW